MPKFLVVILFLFLQVIGFSQSPELNIHVIGVSEIKGTIRIAIFSDAENFKAKIHPYDSAILEIKSTKASHTFKLRQNTYAVAVYHDENDDNQLNKRSMGIPTEGIGFSNIYKKSKRPPRFDESSFFLKSDTTILIPIFYDKK